LSIFYADYPARSLRSRRQPEPHSPLGGVALYEQLSRRGLEIVNDASVEGLSWSVTAAMKCVWPDREPPLNLDRINIDEQMVIPPGDEH
jgi:hypothetical protein